jgi:plastocyanin
MTVGRRQSAIRRSTVAAAAAMGLFAAVTPLTIAHAVAGASITITSGACGGGGTSYCFSPESAAVLTGQAVTWINQSGVGHTASSCNPSACAGAPANTGSNTFNVSIGSASGSTGSFTFTRPGTYYYYCTIHGNAAMHGRITVTAQPSSPTPTPAPRGTPPSSPATGGAPGPLGGIALAFGAAVLALAAILRRR